MPYYDYRCMLCQELFEAEHSMDGPDPRSPIQCPVCGTAEVNKVYLSSPGVSIWFRNPGLAHHPEEKSPKYMPPVLAKEGLHAKS
jgi:putative FmdB family regulatory protein